MSDEGTEELEKLEHDEDFLRLGGAVGVSRSLEQLIQAEDVSARAAMLRHWAILFPRATAQLLTVISESAKLSTEFAPTVLASDLRYFNAADDVLITAMPNLEGPFRDAARDRIGVREALQITEPTSVKSPEPEWFISIGKPFPPIETIAGVQARLNYLGFGAGPITGEWDEQTRRAFAQFQVANALSPSGELDPESIECLAVNTPDVAD